METKKQIQKLVEIGFTKENLSKQSPEKIQKLYESMVNAHGFVGYGKMDKPIGRMFSAGKKSETKEETTKVTKVLDMRDTGDKAKANACLKNPTDPNCKNVEIGEVTESKKKRKKIGRAHV